MISSASSDRCASDLSLAAGYQEISALSASWTIAGVFLWHAESKKIRNYFYCGVKCIRASAGNHSDSWKLNAKIFVWLLSVLNFVLQITLHERRDAFFSLGKFSLAQYYLVTLRGRTKVKAGWDYCYFCDQIFCTYLYIQNNFVKKIHK